MVVFRFVVDYCLLVCWFGWLLGCLVLCGGYYAGGLGVGFVDYVGGWFAWFCVLLLG